MNKWAMYVCAIVNVGKMRETVVILDKGGLNGNEVHAAFVEWSDRLTKTGRAPEKVKLAMT